MNALRRVQACKRTLPAPLFGKDRRMEAFALPPVTVLTLDAVEATPGQLAAAEQAGLRYVCDDGPGYSRLPFGDWFEYFDEDGRQLVDEATLERIDALAIPPAYTEVWICPDPRGHLQATGRDARARKQYRYHADWRHARDHGKFSRIVDFGQRLPRLRRRLSRDLERRGTPRDKVLALAVSVMAETLIRVGNHEYARQNNSFGLTTLRDRHVRFPRGAAIFEFRGKSGKDHVVECQDERLAKLLRRCQQLPGQKLFQYLDEQGVPRPIGSGDVNDYLREACGEDFTAKDFRTWGGTLAAIKAFVRNPPPEGASERTLTMLQNAAVKEVAAQLGNTPAVCRASYIHPRVFAGWRDGTLAAAVVEADLPHPRKLERLALAFLGGGNRRGELH
jgi:DNA topoisomerase IB